MHKIQVKKGQEVLKTIKQYLNKRKIKEAVIVSVIGAVDECQLITRSKDNPKQNVVKKYREPFELLGNGEVTKGEPNIHVVLARANNEALAGHLVQAIPRVHFVNIFLIPY